MDHRQLSQVFWQVFVCLFVLPSQQNPASTTVLWLMEMQTWHVEVCSWHKAAGWVHRRVWYEYSVYTRDRIDTWRYHDIDHKFCFLRYRRHVSSDNMVEPISNSIPCRQLERDTQRPHIVQNVSCCRRLSLVILFSLATHSLSSCLTWPQWDVKPYYTIPWPHPRSSSPLCPPSSGVTVNSLMVDVPWDQLKRPIDRADKAICFQLLLP